MNPVLAELIKSEKFRDYIETLKTSKTPIAVLGLSEVGARANSFLYRRRNKKTYMPYNL